MTARIKLATLTVEKRQPPETSAEITARERHLSATLTGMLPCLPGLRVSELQLRMASDAAAERWHLCLVPRVQGLLSNAHCLNRTLDQDADMVFADLQSLQSRLRRAMRQVKTDLEIIGIPLRYRDALHATCLRAERASWSFDLQSRQFQLPLDGSLQSRRDACATTARARLQEVAKRRVLLRQVELSRPDNPGLIVCRMHALAVYVPEQESGALLLVNHRQLFLGQVWEGSINLERSSVSGEIIGGVLCVAPVAPSIGGDERPSAHS